ncbi:MAG: hypothetical protein ACC645_11140 [Pirellulales bacterium]
MAEPTRTVLRLKCPACQSRLRVPAAWEGSPCQCPLSYGTVETSHRRTIRLPTLSIFPCCAIVYAQRSLILGAAGAAAWVAYRVGGAHALVPIAPLPVGAIWIDARLMGRLAWYLAARDQGAAAAEKRAAVAGKGAAVAEKGQIRHDS